jgi:hypothetical protein
MAQQSQEMNEVKDPHPSTVNHESLLAFAHDNFLAITRTEFSKQALGLLPTSASIVSSRNSQLTLMPVIVPNC